MGSFRQSLLEPWVRIVASSQDEDEEFIQW